MLRTAGYTIAEIYSLDVDDFREFVEYEYVLKMSQQIREYQLAGVDVERIETYREFIAKYSKPVNIEEDAEEAKYIINALRRERWQEIKR